MTTTQKSNRLFLGFSSRQMCFYTTFTQMSIEEAALTNKLFHDSGARLCRFR